MKLINIKLRGFTGIKKGLGLDEINVNFESMAGLIALEGPNGVGKTTFLESLQPYRMFASRSGTLKGHCFLKDSFKELTFEFAGNVYRTLIKIDATSKRSDEGYIYLNSDPSSLVDSKVSNYDDHIINLMGTPTLFFSSIFSAQGGRKLSDLKPAEIKNLFAEFLRLYRYVQWEETSKGAMQITTAAASGFTEQEKQLDTKIRMMGDPRNDLKGGKTLLKKAVSALAENDSKLIGVDKVLTILKKQVNELELNRQRIKDHEKVIEDLKNGQMILNQGWQSENMDRMMRLEELNQEVCEKQKIIIDKEVIEAAIIGKKAAWDERENLNTEQATLYGKQQKHATAMSELKKQEHESNNRLQRIEADPKLLNLKAVRDSAALIVETAKEKVMNLESEDTDIALLKAKIVAMKKSAKVLDDIDPGCTSEICGLITVSLENRDNLPETERELENLRKSKLTYLGKLKLEAIEKFVITKDEVTEYQAKLVDDKEKERVIQDGLQVQIENIEGWQSALVIENLAKTKKIDDLGLLIENLIPMADKHASLAAAEQIEQAHRKEMEKIRETCKTRDAAHMASIQLSEKKVAETQAVIDSIEINEEAETQLKDAEAESKKLTEGKTALEADKNKWINEITKYEKEIESLEALELELKTVKGKLVSLRGYYSQWSRLAAACSKDGMRALEIEAVAPVITKNANDLLTTTFGPAHSVRFETQDEEGREVLRIIVISPDGSETALDLLSGGEKVWILKALRLAQTLISQEKSGRHFQMALMDEEDGALSSKNAIRFIKLYRTFMDMASMDQCLYISHRPEAVSMADNILRFERGRISIV